MTFPFLPPGLAEPPLPEDATGLPEATPRQRFRTVWISDLHLGVPESRADLVYDFLRHTDCEYLYLVGDIVDCWRLRKSWYWPQLYNNLCRTILGKAKNGAEVVYVPGNHDEVFRQYLGLDLGAIAIRRELVHETVDGRLLLVMHGDEFDSIVKHQRWLAHIGSAAYELALKANRWLNAVRRLCGCPYWSLSAYLKRRVKNAVQYLDNFEHAVRHEARRRGADGLVCGHLHHARLTTSDELIYGNAGDWVESCTALVEHLDGRLEIINWREEVQRRAAREVAHAVDTRVGRLAAAG